MGVQGLGPAAQDVAGFEVNIANLSLPLPLLILGSVGQYERYLRTLAVEGSGQTPGLEFTPTRSILLQRIRQLDSGTMRHSSYDSRVREAKALGAMIRSVHASFRGETAGDSLAGRLFPRMLDSVDDMEAVQRVVDRRLHAVGYARYQGEAIKYADNDGRFKEWSVQPKLKDWELWDLSETSKKKQIGDAKREHGFTSFTVDTAHSQAFDNPLELCKKLSRLGWVSEVHLALNRQDMAAQYGEDFARKTRQAKEAFMRSPEAAAKTLEGEILIEVVRDWKIAGRSGAVVYEESPSRLSLPRSVHYQQKAIIENTYALIANVKV